MNNSEIKGAVNAAWSAAMDAGLDDETYWGIIKNYSDLYAKYGG